jgi:HSP20 family protein
MDQKDTNFPLADGVLTIKGEKQSKPTGRYTANLAGSVPTSPPLEPDVDPDQVNAKMKNGMLTVTAKKRPEAQRQVKRIPVLAS